MPDFQLHPQLAEDCLVLGKLEISSLLLMNNALVPWFILVPHTEHREIFQLEFKQQEQLFREINLLSECVMQKFAVEKLNVAAIGNLVSQLHIHVVGRHSQDYCWPGVVWGAQGKQAYSEDEIIQVRQKVIDHFGKHLSPV